MSKDLNYLLDRIAIEEVLNRYAHLLDSGQSHLVAKEVFSEDADIQLGGLSVVGRDAITNALKSMPPCSTSHNLTNVVIHVNGDQASALSSMLAWHWFGDTDAGNLRPADMVGVGGYQDTLKRTPDGWRICHRRGMSFGSGVGIGAVPEELNALMRAMVGVKPVWPAHD